MRDLAMRKECNDPPIIEDLALNLELQNPYDFQLPALESLKQIILTALQLADYNRPADLTLRITDNAEIQELNRNFRGKDTPTNVLSFPFEVPDFLRHEVSTLGDIIIAMPIIEIEAMRQRKSVDDHLTHLIIHGTLHLLGFDHLEEAEAEEMEALEIKILQTLGIQNPYLV